LGFRGDDAIVSAQGREGGGDRVEELGHAQAYLVGEGQELDRDLV
jgi:hypothetical protein